MADLPDRVKKLLPDEVLNELLAGARGEEEIVGPRGLLSQLTKRLVERALEVELTDHLRYEPHLEPGGAGNARNGTTPKTLLTEHGAVQIDAPRDRAGTFEPQIVRKRQRRFEGVDEKILALYSRELSTKIARCGRPDAGRLFRQGKDGRRVRYACVRGPHLHGTKTTSQTLGGGRLDFGSAFSAAGTSSP